MKFKNAEIGDMVYDIILGEWGKIIDIIPEDVFPLRVKFSTHIGWYTFDGKESTDDKNPTIYWNKVNLPTDKEDKPPFNLKKFLIKNLEPISYDDREYGDTFTIFYDGVHHEHCIQSSIVYIPRALYFKTKSDISWDDILLTLSQNAVSWKQLDDTYKELGWIIY